MDSLGVRMIEIPRFMVREEQLVRFSSVFLLLLVDLLRFKPEPIGHALHGVQRPKPLITGSNAPTHTECAQPECGMGSSPESLRSEYDLCGRRLKSGV
ncbi:hypothetical protein CRG98_016566 [Punica granatum]|uniref:Uncharacterized protein n=1 Tax=Punica granatum TaxID=22663 RepID=A0A2I0K3C8_PUNGR|nr:hypothetical protein CRG98_016566 [Punica granatum]